MKYLEGQYMTDFCCRQGGGDHTFCPSSLCLRTHTGLFTQALCLGEAKECCPMYSKILSRSFKV